MKSLSIISAIIAICAGAHAQEQRSARERDILVSLDVGYNTAFREKSWVPVTVDIVNEQRDFDGHIEVRLFDYGNQQQSPVYRMPAQCPQNSRKRFTLYAFLDGVERVEVWLFERGRRATDVPAYMQVRPVAKDDVLLLVLDDDAFNYGFLYAAVQRAGRAVRLSRHGLPTSDLDRLPDIPQAYEAFDAIVLGDIDPERIAARHRALITNYVAQGGTLAVGIGENAADYRGSWLAPLLGAQIGETTLTTEKAVSVLVPPDLLDGLRPDRQVEFAALTPEEGVQAAGHGGRLATRRAFGAGYIYTVAIDATSHALQDTPGYQALWRAILARERKDEDAPQLNLDQFAMTLSQALPNLSGVTIRPLGWVMSYLLLYIGIGIVGNWIVWNRLKRREMAWFCMVGFSMAFTVYAMLFGRSGNLREAQQQTAGLLQIEPGSPRAKFNMVSGILTARTRTFTGQLGSGNIVVRDAATQSTEMNAFTGMPGRLVNARPFAWVQGETHRVENFRVGASELRLLTLEGEMPLPGGFEGAITVDENGARGELVNTTGIVLESPMFVYDRVFIPMKAEGDRLSVDVGQGELARLRGLDDNNPEQLQYYYGYFMGRDDNAVWRGVRMSLFIDDAYQYQFGMPGYVIGWNNDALAGVGFTPDQPMTESKSRTLVVARVLLNDNRAQANETPLSVHVSGEWFRSRGQPPMRYNQPVTQQMPGPLSIRLPHGIRETGEGDLIVELYWGREREEFRGILVPEAAASNASEEAYAWHNARRQKDEPVSYGSLGTRTTYRISDWRAYLDVNEPIVKLGAALWRIQDENDEERRFRDAGIPNWAEYSASAYFESRAPATSTEEGWPQWR